MNVAFVKKYKKRVKRNIKCPKIIKKSNVSNNISNEKLNKIVKKRKPKSTSILFIGTKTISKNAKLQLLKRIAKSKSKSYISSLLRL